MTRIPVAEYLRYRAQRKPVKVTISKRARSG